MRTRKDVNVFLHSPSTRFFQIVVELRNEPGALHDFLGILHDSKINILGSFSSVDMLSNTGIWSGFVEDSNHTATELKAKIESSRRVLSSIVAESVDGLLVDGIHFPLSFNTGDRAILMRSQLVSSMLSSVRKRFGSGGDVIIFEEGQIYGREAWTNYAKRLGASFMLTHLQQTMFLYQALGWFKLDGVEQRAPEGSAVVRVHDCFECEGAKSRGPYSHFVRGHLSGGMTALIGKEVGCEETKCVAAGDSYCEFVLTPKPASNQPREEMKVPA